MWIVLRNYFYYFLIGKHAEVQNTEQPQMWWEVITWFIKILVTFFFNNHKKDAEKKCDVILFSKKYSKVEKNFIKSCSIFLREENEKFRIENKKLFHEILLI